MKIKNNWRAVGLLIFSGLGLAGCTESMIVVDRLCTYQPTAESDNVLGKDAQLEVQEKGGNTIFSYQALPSVPVADNIRLNAKRELIFTNTQLDTARVILLQNQKYFNQLVGKESEKGFEAVNEFLNCE